MNVTPVWLGILRPGDWIVFCFFALLTALSFAMLWRGGAAEHAVVRRDGRILAELPLDRARRIEVEGALGVSVIETAPGKARVAADPGPRQYCVKQGWLTQANAMALCVPNHISLMLRGKDAAYDSLNY